ncbi:MAG TPA: 1-phosphofructokinase family hexose kinase [Xanthobacteraceae bacterium]|nr:1-phosphofructokinase family hexose kinase [Xanthobacteraceae bacterium]
MTDIVALTLNPSIDISTSVERVEPASKLRCSSPRLYPGGGGVNVARVALRLGAGVELIYPTGGSTGHLLRRLVEREGIPNLAVDLAQETREDLTVFEEATGAEYRFVLPGPRVSENEWRNCLEILESLHSRPKFMVASGSLPPDVPQDFYARVAKIARRLDAKFVLDTSGTALEPALKEGVYLLKPNLRELSEFVGADMSGDNAIIEASRRLIARYGVKIVVTSLGEQGAMLVSVNQVMRAEAPHVHTLSAVGAGDSFLGALVSRLATGHSLEDAFRYAVAAGAAAVLTPGTALCNRQDVERLLPQVRIRNLQTRELAATHDR